MLDELKHLNFAPYCGQPPFSYELWTAGSALLLFLLGRNTLRIFHRDQAGGDPTTQHRVLVQ